MAGFKTQIFRGIRPRVSPLKLPEGEAITASNTKLGSGDLEPWADREDVKSTFRQFFTRTIWLYDNDGRPVWFEWDKFVDVARGSVKGDDLERVYYTGDGVPKMTYRTIAIGDQDEAFPGDFRKLGIPAPATAPTAEAGILPEEVSSLERRTAPDSIVTKAFEITTVEWSIYPGGPGAPNGIWNLSTFELSAGDIVFDFGVGSTAKVIEVIDDDIVTLGSAAETGVFAATQANDRSETEFYNTMDETGADQRADWIGFRIPDGLQVTIFDHKLRVGDVIRVTRTDNDEGLRWTTNVSEDIYEQDWGTPQVVVINGVPRTQLTNALVGFSADGTQLSTPLIGGFYYDVDRLASDSGVLEDRTYVYTYVSNLGEEGPPSPASAVIEALDGDTITITGMELPPTDGYEITHMNLYRTNATAAGTEFQFVKTFEIDTETTENVRAASLGDIIESTTWDPPPVTMQGITAMPNGMMVGFVNKNLYFCEPYFPHAWPAQYDQAIDYNIVGLAAFGNSVAVLTEGVPYVLTGSHPRNVNLRPYKINQACIAPRSIATTADRVIYASPDGLVEISVNGARIVTEEYFEKDEWAAIDPASIVGEFHDNKYFGFYGALPSDPTELPPIPFPGSLAQLEVRAGGVPERAFTEESIRAGGDEIIITLVGDSWVAAGAPFDDIRQSIIEGISSTSGFVTGWNLAVRPNIPVTDVVRTDDATVTITLTARPEYSSREDEIVNVIVPAVALTQTADTGTATTPEAFTILTTLSHSSRVIAFTEIGP